MPDMAAALGTDTSRIYAVTFAFGSALAGLPAACLRRFPACSRPLAAPISAALHHRDRRRRRADRRHRFGVDFFGIINQIATFATNPVYGEVALLLAAIVLIRALPQGITGRYLRRSL